MDALDGAFHFFGAPHDAHQILHHLLELMLHGVGIFGAPEFCATLERFQGGLRGGMSGCGSSSQARQGKVLWP